VGPEVVAGSEAGRIVLGADIVERAELLRLLPAAGVVEEDGLVGGILGALGTQSGAAMASAPWPTAVRIRFAASAPMLS
jgi:hypothetical protein